MEIVNEPKLGLSTPIWYCLKTGIYSSKYPTMPLPIHPFTNVVTHIFSKKHTGTLALVDSVTGHSISYSDLLPRVKSVASGLRQLGISHGDVVMILLPNSIYFPIILLGVLYLGAVVSPMNPLSSSNEIKKQALDCRAKIAFAMGTKSQVFDTLGLKTITVPESLDSGNSEFFSFFTSDPNLAPSAKISQDDTAAIMYSSGTTGTCKGVVLTHRNFISVIDLFVRFEASQYEYLASENVYLAVLPMFHIYGMSLFVMGLFTLGGTIVVMRKFDIGEMVRAIDTYKVTHFHAVPPLINALTEVAKGRGRERVKSLKQVTSGAAPLSRKSAEEFVRMLPNVDFIQAQNSILFFSENIREKDDDLYMEVAPFGLRDSFSVNVGYGMTESTAVATRGFNTKTLRNYTSVGLLSPNTEAKVVDIVTGSFMPPRRRGELLLRGPGTMKGYLNNPEATAQVIDRDGWLHTGDIVYFDEDGYIYVCDRLKEMIKYKGFQIAPAELESLLITHPDVIDAAVTAANDDEAGEVPIAFVVKRNGSRLSEAALSDYVAKQVSPYKKLRKIVFTQSIPKSPAGKILRKDLKTLISARL